MCTFQIVKINLSKMMKFHLLSISILSLKDNKLAVNFLSILYIKKT